jgi:nitrogenase molybdenum-iron protein beta chain
MNNFIDRPRYVCALGGAVATINALPRAIPILHAAAGCGGNVSTAFNAPSGYLGSGYCGGMALPSSNVFEHEIVFGGEERLAQQIEKTLELIDGDLFVVISGCMVEIIGDNVNSVAGMFRKRGLPVLAVETGGFRGNSYAGYELVLKTLFRDFVARSNVTHDRLINLWGIVPAQDVFWKGNLKMLKGLLERLGLRVNTFFGDGESLDQLKDASSAVLNVVVSTNYGIEAAKLFEEIHGVPFVSLPFPIGNQATKSLLRTVGSALNIEYAEIDRLMAREEKYYFDYLERVIDIYNDMDLQRYALVVGDVNYAPALTRFLSDDLGWLPELAVITDILDDEQKMRIAAEFTDYQSALAPSVIFDKDTSGVLKHLKNLWPDPGAPGYHDTFSPGFIIGSSFEKDLSEKLGLPLLAVSYPVTNRVVLDRSYAGFEGGLRLAEDILSILVSGR